MTGLARAGVVLCLILLSIVPARGAVLIRRVPDHGLEPRAAVDSRGTIHLIYFAGEPLHGDVFYVRSSDAGEHFTKPIRVNSEVGSALVVGGVRGPQLALGKNGRVHVAWNGSDKATLRSPVAGAPMLYARLNDAGDAFEPQRNLMTRTGHLDGGGSIAADDTGHVYVAWHGAADKDDTEELRRIWLARSDDDGKSFAPESAADVPATGACACCAAHLFIATDGKPRVLYRSASEMVHRDMYLLAFDPPTVKRLSEWRVGTCVMSTAASAGDWIAWESKETIHLANLRDPTALIPTMARTNPKHPALAVAKDGSFVLAWTEKTGWNRGGRMHWWSYDSHGKMGGNATSFDDLPAWDYPAVVALPGGDFVIFY